MPTARGRTDMLVGRDVRVVAVLEASNTASARLDGGQAFVGDRIVRKG
jgi:predicted type IV restriction endonuclease